MIAAGRICCRIHFWRLIVVAALFGISICDAVLVRKRLAGKISEGLTESDPSGASELFSGNAYWPIVHLDAANLIWQKRVLIPMKGNLTIVRQEHHTSSLALSEDLPLLSRVMESRGSKTFEILSFTSRSASNGSAEVTISVSDIRPPVLDKGIHRKDKKPRNSIGNQDHQNAFFVPHGFVAVNDEVPFQLKASYQSRRFVSGDVVVITAEMLRSKSRAEPNSDSDRSRNARLGEFRGELTIVARDGERVVQLENLAVDGQLGASFGIQSPGWHQIHLSATAEYTDPSGLKIPFHRTVSDSFTAVSNPLNGFGDLVLIAEVDTLFPNVGTAPSPEGWGTEETKPKTSSFTADRSRTGSSSPEGWGTEETKPESSSFTADRSTTGSSSPEGSGSRYFERTTRSGSAADSPPKGSATQQTGPAQPAEYLIVELPAILNDNQDGPIPDDLLVRAEVVGYIQPYQPGRPVDPHPVDIAWVGGLVPLRPCLAVPWSPHPCLHLHLHAQWLLDSRCGLNGCYFLGFRRVTVRHVTNHAVLWESNDMLLLRHGPASVRHDPRHADFGSSRDPSHTEDFVESRDQAHVEAHVIIAKVMAAYLKGRNATPTKVLTSESEAELRRVMREGRVPAFQGRPSSSGNALTAPSNSSEAPMRDTQLILVHGFCSTLPIWPSEQFPGAVQFIDLRQAISNDEFARHMLEFSEQYETCAIIAHSQGGMAALHMYSYYFSCLDRNTNTTGRLIQTVGTGWLGCSLATFLAFFDPFCPFRHVHDLTPTGAHDWLNSIPAEKRAAVHFWRVAGGSFFRPCWWRTDFILKHPNDGIIELERTFLDGGQSHGVAAGECHCFDMHYMPETFDVVRNQELFNWASRVLPLPVEVPPYVQPSSQSARVATINVIVASTLVLLVLATSLVFRARRREPGQPGTPTERTPLLAHV